MDWKNRLEGQMQMAEALGPPIKKVKVKCKCPSCGKSHKVKMEWTGSDYAPPKYCNKCKKAIENTDPLVFEVNEMAVRRIIKAAQ